MKATKTKRKSKPVEKQPDLFAKHPDFIYKQVVPYFVENTEMVENALKSFISARRLEKTTWMDIYKVLDTIAGYIAENEWTPIIAFDRRFFTPKYKENHTDYYILHATESARRCLTMIERARNMEDPDMRDHHFYLAAEHLFFFLITKEKLGLTEEKDKNNHNYANL